MGHFAIGPVRLVTPDAILDSYLVEILDQKIQRVIPFDQRDEKLPLVDGENLYLSAGFIDIHVHGGGGSDFMDGTKEAFCAAMSSHMKSGTTSICPTTSTGSLDELCAVFGVAREVMDSPEYETLPELIGIHMEGPYVAPVMAGAQDPKFIRVPTDKEYFKIVKAAEQARVPAKIWTVAPELPGAAELCEDLKSTGAVFSFGHTDCQYKHVKQAVEAGYTMATHLFSSMSTITRENGFRKLGAIESALLMDDVTVEVIGDGMHLPPELLQLIYKCKGPDKICLVTDAMRGSGMPDGIYKLGSLKNGQDTIVGGGIARMMDGIFFGGSVATSNRLIRVMHHQAGFPLNEVIGMMTKNPARALGILDRKGLVEPGYDADLILFNDNIDIQHVFVRGTKTV